eukprot:gene1930-1070_t
MSENLTFSNVVIASSISGITSRIILHPIDTIKARLQVQKKTSAFTALSKGGNELYKSNFHAFQTIHKYEGFKGFYRGLGVAVAFSGPANAVFLGSYDIFKNILSNQFDKESFFVQFTSGFLAETVSCIFWVPHDVMKERLQVSRSHSNGFREVFKVVKNDGIRQLYKGYWITLGTFGPNSAIYFFGYEQIKKIFINYFKRDEIPFYSHLISASISNSIAAIITNPLDVIKTRFQVQRRNKDLNSNEIYKNFKDAFTKILKEEGVNTFYKGLGARIMYSAPNSAIIMDSGDIDDRVIRDVKLDYEFFQSQVDVLFPKEYQQLIHYNVFPSKKDYFEVLGCGPGAFSRSLIDQNKKIRITCMEIDDKFVSFNEEYNENHPKYRSRMNNLQGSIFNTKLPSNHFDVIISRFVYQHIYHVKDIKDPIEKANKEMMRILKPGGKFIIVDSDQDYPDFVYPECRSCSIPQSKGFKVISQINKKPRSNGSSGSNLYLNLKNNGFLNIKHDLLYVSSDQYKDGIKKFLPMIYPYNLKNLYDLKKISFEQMNKIENEFKSKYIEKKYGEPRMTISIFISYGEKYKNNEQSKNSFIDDIQQHDEL